MVCFGSLAGLDAQPPAEQKTPKKRADVFGPDKLWNIHLIVGKKEYEDMKPTGGNMFFPFPKKDEPKKEDPKKDPKAPPADVHKSKGFGMEFPWVKADIEFEGKLVKDVGLRYTGNSTDKSSEQGLKRPFKGDFNHFDDKQKLLGMGAATPFDAVLAKHCTHVELQSTATARQGASLELVYKLTLNQTATPMQLLNELSRLEGVQNLELKRSA
jgi:hypothetical protein